METALTLSGKPRFIHYSPVHAMRNGAFAFAMACCSFTAVFAQTPAANPTPTPTAEEQRLIDANTLLQLQKTNADLKKGIRDDQPKPSATPLTGKTTIDDNVAIETQMVTFKAMSTMADRISNEIRHLYPNTTAIVIYNADDAAAVKHYRTSFPLFTANIEALERQYDRLLNTYRRAYPPPEPHELNLIGSIELGASAVGSFADLVALFRTDTEIKGKSVTIEESTLVAETFRALRSKFSSGIDLYYPKLFPVQQYEATCDSQQGTKVFCSPMLRLLEHLYRRKDAANSLLVEMPRIQRQIDIAIRDKTDAETRLKDIATTISDLRDQLKKTTTDADKKDIRAKLTEDNNDKRDVEKRRGDAIKALDAATLQKSYLDPIKDINQQFDQFVTSITQVSDKTGNSELALLANAENIDKVFMSGTAYWLELRAVAAGGNNRSRTNLILYFAGSRVDHSGGVVVEWQLFNKDGSSADSNMDRSYEGYKTSKAIKSDKFTDVVPDPKLSGDPPSQPQRSPKKPEIIDDAEAPQNPLENIKPIEKKPR